MRNLKILIEYDGTNFSGWQYQPHARTVQGSLQEAVFQITRESVTVEGAGRTDAGVHASGQVGNFRIAKAIDLGDLVKGLNAVLPPDLRILGVENVPDEFHARFSARERRYRYTISRRPTALRRATEWHYPHALDVDRMQSACASILGEHNFRSFCLSVAEVTHYRCEVRFAQWTQEGDRLFFDIGANRFLHTMVRCLVGTFLQIGRRKWPPEELERILQLEDRKQAGFTAPAHGLCLREVLYGSA